MSYREVCSTSTELNIYTIHAGSRRPTALDSCTLLQAQITNSDHECSLEGHKSRNPHQSQLVSMLFLYPGRTGIWRCWFLWKKENQRTRRKTLGATPESTTNSIHIWQQAGNEPRPHWWEASALITASRLLLKIPMLLLSQSGHTSRHETAPALAPNTITSMNVMKYSDFQPKISIMTITITTFPTRFVGINVTTVSHIYSWHKIRKTLSLVGLESCVEKAFTGYTVNPNLNTKYIYRCKILIGKCRFLLFSVIILSEVRTSANKVAVNVTVLSGNSGMFILIRRWKRFNRRQISHVATFQNVPSAL